MSIRRSARLGAKATPASTLDGLANFPSARQPMPSNLNCAVSTEEEEDEYQSESEDEYQMAQSAEVLKKAGRSMRTRDGSKPSKKRQATRTPAARSRVQGRLKNIMAMPLDILFEICFHLGPADLVPLARTSKFLREVLMDRRHAFIWKTARLNVPGLVPPDPPIGMSEPAWARLLYGGSGCYSCSAVNVKRIDLGLRRRVCMGCRLKQLIPESQYKKLCPGADTCVMNLIGYTRVGAKSRGHECEGRYFWKPDVLDMGHRFKQLGSIGGSLAIREFRLARKGLVHRAMKQLPMLEAWVEEWENQKASDREDAYENRYSDALARLYDNGYDERDIPYSSISIWSRSSQRELTDIAWKRLLSKLQDELANNRDKRLEDEKSRRINQRCATAAKLYCGYLRTLVPVQWKFLPTPQHIVETRFSVLPSFHRLLHMSDEPSEEQWEDAARAVPGELSTHLLAHLERLAEGSLTPDDLPAVFTFALASEGSDAATMDALYLQYRLLDMASTVSAFSRYEWTTGYDNIHTWDRTRVSGYELGLSSQGSDAIGVLTELLGKYMTATATELDIYHSDTWFLCTSCKDAPHRAYHVGWRSWLDHRLRYPSIAHQPELAPSNSSRSESVYKPAHGDDHKRWVCTHCCQYCIECIGYDSAGLPRYKDSFGSRAILIEHNMAKHDISDPNEHYDFFYHSITGQTRPLATALLTPHLIPDLPDPFRKPSFQTR